MNKLITVASIGLAFLMGALPVGAIAAPFCLVLPNSTPQCMYVDGATCARDAGRQNGSCQPNPAELRVPSSLIGNYCLVLPSGASTCGYADGNLCARDALIQKGACARSAGSLPQVLPNDYAPNAGR